MSRIGKQPITIPTGTEVSVSDGVVLVKGPAGELTRSYKPEYISISVDNGQVVLTPTDNSLSARALWGTYASHIRNMIKGVHDQFEKTLVIEGIGYRAECEGNKLSLSVGFSHKVDKIIPQNLQVEVKKNVISVKGPDKDMVGQFARSVRAVRKPEPYKGKGIRYSDEVVKRKQGKRAVT
jgi:large subunit ribosomal protein L6